jgi:hypothetical protein
VQFHDARNIFVSKPYDNIIQLKGDKTMTVYREGKYVLAESVIPMYPENKNHIEREDTKKKHKEKNKYYVYALIYDFNHLYLSYRKAIKGSSWKRSVQIYEKNSLYNLYQLHNKLIEHTYEQRDFYEFDLNERGKKRRIKAMYVEDRIVQRDLSDYILTPVVKDYLIYDNGASLKDKGVDFCRKRLEKHLHSYYQKYGNQGYILKIDFAKFFDNLLHDYARSILFDVITDDETRGLINEMIKSFRLDVSYMSDDEYAQCLITTFNSLDYQFLSNGKQTGEKIMDKSVGIGSHISQICGIFYPSEIDNFCKIVKGLKYYGRYMDDIYIIFPDKEYLQQLLIEITEKCEGIGIHINQKKTQIIPLTSEFVYLQVKYRLTDTGHLIRRIPAKTFKRERRRLKSMRRLIDADRMTYSDAGQCYKSWRGSIERYDSYHSLMTMDDCFHVIIGKSYEECANIKQAHFSPEDCGLDRKDYKCSYRDMHMYNNVTETDSA